MKALISILFVVLLAACAGPRYSGYGMERDTADKTVAVQIVKDEKTRDSFVGALTSWMNKRGYKYKILTRNERPELDQVTIRYKGYWGWDLALFLSRATVDADLDGHRVGEVEFAAPNSMHLGKYGDATDRIHYLMDVLFGVRTIEEANAWLGRQK